MSTRQIPSMYCIKTVTMVNLYTLGSQSGQLASVFGNPSETTPFSMAPVIPLDGSIMSSQLLPFENSPTLRAQLEPTSNQMKRKKPMQSHIRSVRMVELFLSSPRERDRASHIHNTVCNTTSAISATPPTMR